MEYDAGYVLKQIVVGIASFFTSANDVDITPDVRKPILRNMLTYRRTVVTERVHNCHTIERLTSRTCCTIIGSLLPATCDYPSVAMF
jgi:hypothetical protein